MDTKKDKDAESAHEGGSSKTSTPLINSLMFILSKRTSCLILMVRILHLIMMELISLTGKLLWNLIFAAAALSSGRLYAPVSTLMIPKTSLRESTTTVN